MQMVLVSGLLFASVLVWGLVQVMKLVTAWKILEELDKAKVEQLELATDLDLAVMSEKWKAQGLE